MSIDDAVLTSKFTASTPPALCYADDQESYASNEIAINWNAPLVFVAGYFAAGGAAVDVPQGNVEPPKRINLFRNFPNPFNPSTTIRFSIPYQTYVSVKIYDSLGREVETLVREMKDAGEYSIHWVGNNVPSGVYYGRIQAGGYDASLPMVLVR